MIPHGFGVGIPHQRAESDVTWYDTALAALHPGWWVNWKYDQLHRPGYVPMVWRCNDEWVDRALPIALQEPERLWLLGNEPERPDQSDTTPEEFAQAAREWRKAGLGPWAAPGILIDPFDYGRDWLAAYLAAGGPLPDAWHIHIYAYFAQDWMGCLQKALAYLPGGLPVILSECAAWGAAGNSEVMGAVLDALRRGDIAAAAWFSVYYDAWLEPSLLTASGELTELGRLYVNPPPTYTVYLPLTVA